MDENTRVNLIYILGKQGLRENSAWVGRARPAKHYITLN